MSLSGPNPSSTRSHYLTLLSSDHTPQTKNAQSAPSDQQAAFLQTPAGVRTEEPIRAGPEHPSRRAQHPTRSIHPSGHPSPTRYFDKPARFCQAFLTQWTTGGANITLGRSTPLATHCPLGTSINGAAEIRGIIPHLQMNPFNNKFPGISHLHAHHHGPSFG
ncbi:hypothetical protein PTTG_29426 [Puccinia triticina 1-1 BBBD Race 1]|uniref:Uncharacterized protein n=1 Tax=Puccinia triticina (isolate 1-1 / race 1 (BBBD)) TaxID=630390 RepID=A0A180G435_PUCT1|nr:hypothetical protein PTTG_29426 [Puccinia triticina 1-1 BBBD Race 1]